MSDSLIFVGTEMYNSCLPNLPPLPSPCKVCIAVCLTGRSQQVALSDLLMGHHL